MTGIGKKCFNKIEGQLSVRNTIEKNILGLVTIKGLTNVIVFEPLLKFTFNNIPNFIFREDIERASRIINIHLQENRDIMDCQEELIQAGYKQFARL